jgi:hypothetical protein
VVIFNAADPPGGQQTPPTLAERGGRAANDRVSFRRTRPVRFGASHRPSGLSGRGVSPTRTKKPFWLRPWVARLQTAHRDGDNRFVPDLRQTAASPVPTESPFQPGALILATLADPREKFWGAILALTGEGLSLCGIELASFEDLVSMVKEGEPVSPSVIFFPMHRVERIELDLPDGNIPSLAHRFKSKTGLDAGQLLVGHSLRSRAAPEERA